MWPNAAVWQGKIPKRQWMINQRGFGLEELPNALKSYWNEISAGFPGVQTIEVMVIDLTLREHASDS